MFVTEVAHATIWEHKSSARVRHPDGRMSLRSKMQRSRSRRLDFIPNSEKLLLRNFLIIIRTQQGKLDLVMRNSSRGALHRMFH